MTMTMDPVPKRTGNIQALVILALVSCVLVSMQEDVLSFLHHKPDVQTAKAQSVVRDASIDGGRSAINQRLNEHDDDSLAQICYRLLDGKNSQIIPSAGTLWTTEAPLIKQALLHSPSNEPFGSRTSELKTLIDQVFQALPLDRLRRSVRPATLSSSDIKLRRILDVLWKRYHDPDNNPPLQVLVFGGSPTAGSNCERNGRLKKQGQCAWPGHLQLFANAYLGFDAIRVVNYAIGATSSQMATMMLRLRLFPLSMDTQGPDVIINAYAVNDFSYHSGEIEKNGVLSFLNLFSAFVNAVKDLTSCQKDRPFAIFLDDFSVNYQKGNLVEAVENYRAEISKLTSYHQVLTISFVDMIQDFLFSDSKEEELLVDWKSDGKHIPWGGHMAIVLAFMYNALNIVVELCEQNLSSAALEQESSKQGRSQQLDSYFRPHLDETVALEGFSDQWSNNLETSSQNCNEEDRTETCPFGWVALRKEDEHQHIQDIMAILVKKENWEYVQTWPPTNYGLYGSRNGTAVLHVESSENDAPVESITIIYMKSYSEKWYNSTVQATVHRCEEVVSSVELSGYHDKLTSEYFTETIELPTGSSVCRSVDLTLQMTGGDTFRVGGLSFC